MKSTDPSVTELAGLGLDQPADIAQLTELLYAELRGLARGAMRRERAGHTLQSTALVNEAYLRLREGQAKIESRAHFLALAARVMRQVLIDHARGRERQKRGGDFQRISLTEADPSSDQPLYEILALDQALDSLKAFDPRRARLLEMQLFAGLTYGEMAEALGCSQATVHRELRLARAWLLRQLAPTGPES